MIQKYFSEKSLLVKNQLIEFLDQQAQMTASLKLDCLPFLKKMVISGKLHRGSLVFLGYDLFASDISSELSTDDSRLKLINRLSMVVELTHSAFLLHDDVMDQDQIRRSLPTFHRFAADELKKEGLDDSLKVGESLAICLGDLLIFWANQILADGLIDYDDRQISRSLSSFFHQKMELTAWGQMDDVYLAKTASEVTDEQIFHVYSLKSGHYSVVNPLLLGAIVAGAEKEQLSLLANLAEKTGIIFQIKDDQLNLFGLTEKIGKSVGSDVREDKKTIFRSWLFKLADAEDRKQLEELFGNRSLDGQGIKIVQKLLDKYQVITQVNKLIDKLEAEAKQALSNLQLSANSKELLASFVQLMTQREK